MIWVDRLVKKIKERNLPLEWVDDMKTPSGRIHVGSLRGVIIHDLIYKVLKENRIKAEFSYVFNDMDPMDAVPSYLDFDKWEKYAGMPLNRIPSPKPGFDSFAAYYAQEFIEVFNKLNCYPQIIWSSKLYQSGQMDSVVKQVLDNVQQIRKIYKNIAKAEKPKNWYPYQVICQKCGRLGTTMVYRWDGRYVYYRCLPEYVAWARGCGFEGKVEPKGDNGKLVWKVDWPAHWKVIGVTIESSGKDHMSSGGSYDVASHIAREVFNIDPPEAFGGYEWFTVGGRKMSSSKGVGASAFEVSQILPASVFRFFMVRTPIQTHLDFNPEKEVIFRIFDDYDRCFQAYFDRLEKKIPEGKEGEVTLNFARIFELSAVKELPKKRLFLPRFRTIYSFIQNHKDEVFIADFFQRHKGGKLSREEKDLLKERVDYAQKFFNRFEKGALGDDKNLAVANFSLTSNQKKFLEFLLDYLRSLKKFDPDKFQKEIFNMMKENNLQPKESFNAFYLVITGKPFGPKAGDLVESLGVNEVVKRIEKRLK